MNRIIYFLLVALVGSLSACRSDLTSPMPKAVEAEQLLKSHPDSLVLLLEEKINPTLLCDSDRAYYWYLLTQAHRKSNRGLVNDSMIRFSVQYYKEKQSPRLPMAYMLAAEQTNFSREKKEEQIRGYLAAALAAESMGDSANWANATVKLAALYWRNREFRNSIQMAQQLLARSLSVEYKISAWFQLGLSYSNLNNDSATYCINRSMQIAKETKNSFEPHITRNFADYLVCTNKNKEALHLLDEFEQQHPDYDQDFTVMSRLNASLNLGDLDAAKPYLERLEQIAADEATSTDAIPLQYTTRLFRLIYNAKRGIPLDLRAYGQFNDSLHTTRWLNQSIEKEHIFARNKLIHDKQNLQIENQHLHQMYLSMVIVILIIVALLIFGYQHKLLLKERSIQNAREQMRLHIIRLRENESIISKNEEQIQHISAQLQQSSVLNEQLSGQQTELAEITSYNANLQQENKELQQEISQYARELIQKDQSAEAYERLIERCDLLAEREKQLSTKLTDLIDVLKDLKTGTYAHLSDVDWPQVYSSLNQIFNNYTQRLQCDFPLLTEEDIQCCCLIKLRMTTAAIASIYSITPASATKRKQRIRERINQSKEKPLDKNQSIDFYLWEY